MARPEEILAAMPEAVIGLETSGRVTAWLGAAESLFGWKAGEVLGKDVNEIFSPRLPDGEPARIEPGRPETVGEAGADDDPAGEHPPVEQEFLVKAKDGSEVWAGLMYGYSGNPGGSFATVVVLRDIWRRKRVDMEKSEVISSVAHELRSPLTSVKGFASTLVHRWDRFDDEQRKRILSTIDTDSDRVTRLITELLDLSRLEEGRLQLNKQPVDLPSIAERVVEHLRPEGVNHSLHLEFPHPFPEPVADPDKLEQVLTNLVENALKYSEGGPVTVGGAVNDRTVRVWVSDTGKGIPEDERPKVFRKFFRRDEHPQGSTSGRPGGSGLGLYICKGLIEAHGGGIWVEGAPGGGASFVFELPID